jgi:hypothetical protein
MSSALALVTPRPVGQPAMPEPVEATLVAETMPAQAEPAQPILLGEPVLAVVAQVPDLRPASMVNGPHTAAKTNSVDIGPSVWNANWQLARQKSRAAYHKAAAALSNADMAACWSWIITLPPVVKLGTMLATLVMSLWMFGGKGDEPSVDATPASTWQQGENLTRAQGDSEFGAATAKSGESLWRPGHTSSLESSSPADNSANESQRVARETTSGDAPTIRDIQAAARGYQDGWPRDRADDESVARATVRPIPAHKEPYDSAAMPYDASRTDLADRNAAGGETTRGVVPVSRDEMDRMPVDGRSYDAAPGDRGPQPPTDMSPRWAERNEPSHTTGYSPVQNNPYYSNTASANTAGRGDDGRMNDNRIADNRTFDDRGAAGRRMDDRVINDRRSDDPVVDYRYAGNGAQPSAPQNGDDRFAADRTVAEQRDAEALRRQRAYQIGREDAHAQRPDYSETYRR